MPAPAAPATAGSALRQLAAFLRPTLGRGIAAALLGSGASLFAVALTAVSGWLIVRASEQPPIMYLLVAIVGVRFFGIGRAGLRYAERLASHDAVLGSVTDLRLRLWAGLASKGVAARSLATGAVALDYLVASADRVRDLVPRVVLPPVVALVTGGAALVAVGALHPAAVPVLAGALGIALGVAPLVALVADRAAARGTAVVRSTVVTQFAAIVAAAGDLRGNGVGGRALARLDALDAVAGRHARSTSGALGLGTALVVLACATASVLMLPASAAAVADGALPAAVVAVLALLPLALIEPLTGTIDAVQQWPALSAALRRVDGVASAPRPASADPPALTPVERIELDNLVAGWAGGTGFGPVRASAGRGDWIVVEGPSGSGKSTLVATLMGFVPAASGTWRIDGMDAAALAPATVRSRTAWCPQEAHLFDSTIRGNLLLARGRNDVPSDPELFAALGTAGLGPLVATLPDGLDTRVGPGGDRLSGGERQRLAVARTLLTRADIVLLDEPTAHLDAASAERLMTALRDALADRIVVLVSHHATERRVGDLRVGLVGRGDLRTAVGVPVEGPLITTA